MKKSNEIVDNVMFTLEQAQESVKAGALKQAEFFLASLHRTLEQREEPRYQDVINNLCRFFDDAEFTYTKLFETMAEAQCSVMRLMNELQDRQDKDDPTDFTQVKDVQEFFFKMQLLMWNLKPIAMDMERKLQDLGRDYVGYDVSGK
jgi:Zn-dependent oligopeptidase